MTTQANIVVYDGASTPVAHTLKPMSNKYDEKLGQVAFWRETLSNLPINANVRCTTLEKKLKNGFTRLEIRIEVPVLESVSGQNSAGYTAAAKIAYVNQSSQVLYISDRATEEERRTIRMLSVNIGNNVSASVAAATSGVAAELLDQGITAS
jgi:hypothetical protein